MGSIFTRQQAGVEEINIGSSHGYKYPPRSGNYFSSHFIMGGERFDTPQSESYLFGDNSDLNFLNGHPAAFPYPPPEPNEPTRTLKCLVNIRKESLRFIRCPEGPSKYDFEAIDHAANSAFNIEFTFDCDSPCAITIFYFCAEEVTPMGVILHSKDPAMNSETFHYKEGANQQFCQVSHSFNPSHYSDSELMYNYEQEIIPIAIHCVAESDCEDLCQSHTTIAVVDHHSDGTYGLRALKQKLFADGLYYLLQEIYGIENKSVDVKHIRGDDEMEDNGSECVICMSDIRDTLILPCRHLCLCNSCANSLRYQANNCPICRAPFRALLQIRAVQKSAVIQGIQLPQDCADNVPEGYEVVSLIEALNGPFCHLASANQILDGVSPDDENATQAAEVLNRSSGGRCMQSMKLLGGHDCYAMTLYNKDGVYHNSNEVLGEDSEAGKQSPLLDKATNGSLIEVELEHIFREGDDDEDEDKSDHEYDNVENIYDKKQNSDLQLEQVVEEKNEPLNDVKGEVESTLIGVVGGEDSVYYMPEGQGPAVFISPKAKKENHLLKRTSSVSSVDSTPKRQVGTPFLPGTPQSTNSHHSNCSSGESYSSTSSTRQLLAVPNQQHDCETSMQI